MVSEIYHQLEACCKAIHSKILGLQARLCTESSSSGDSCVSNNATVLLGGVVITIFADLILTAVFITTIVCLRQPLQGVGGRPTTTPPRAVLLDADLTEASSSSVVTAANLELRRRDAGAEALTPAVELAEGLVPAKKSAPPEELVAAESASRS